MSTRDDQKKRIKLSDHDNNCAVTVKSNMKNDKFMSLGQKRDIEEEQQQLHNFQLKTEDLSTDIVNKNNSVEEDYLRSVNCKLMTISEWGKACSIPHDDQHLLPIIDLREEYEFKKQRLKTRRDRLRTGWYGALGGTLQVSIPTPRTSTRTSHLQERYGAFGAELQIPIPAPT